MQNKRVKVKNIKKFPKQSIISSFLGILLFLSGFSLLIWNEFIVVASNKLYDETLMNIKKISNINSVDPKNNGKMVYISGPITLNESLTEPEYGISIPAVLLKRRVQMFQWIEVTGQPSHSTDGKKTSEDISYTYLTDWKDKLIDSSKFAYPTKHQNPKELPISSKIIMNNFVCIGSYCLDKEFKEKFRHFILITSDERPERRDIKMHAGLYYHTADVWNPEVGDTRIQFSYTGTTGDIVSLIGTQQGCMIVANEIDLFEYGKVSSDEMIYNNHNKDMWSHRVLRLISWLLIYISTYYFQSLALYSHTKYYKVTIFFTMDGWLTVNFSLASVVSVTVVSLIWLSFNPWMSLTIWIMVLFPLFISTYFKESRHLTDDYIQLR